MPTACFDVPVTEPFHADDLLDFLRPRAIPGVETVCGTIYSRSLRLAGGPAVIEANLTARGQLSVTATDADDIDEAVNGSLTPMLTRLPLTGICPPIRC